MIRDIDNHFSELQHNELENFSLRFDDHRAAFRLQLSGLSVREKLRAESYQKLVGPSAQRMRASQA
jgi:hypothetical protein